MSNASLVLLNRGRSFSGLPIKAGDELRASNKADGSKIGMMYIRYIDQSICVWSWATPSGIENESAATPTGDMMLFQAIGDEASEIEELTGKLKANSFPGMSLDDFAIELHMAGVRATASEEELPW